MTTKVTRHGIDLNRSNADAEALGALELKVDGVVKARLGVQDDGSPVLYGEGINLRANATDDLIDFQIGSGPWFDLAPSGGVIHPLFDPSSSDHSAAMRALATALSNTDGLKVVFPAIDIFVNIDPASSALQADLRWCFKVAYATNLELDFSACRIINIAETAVDYANTVMFDFCEGLTVTGLTVDWLHKPFLQAVVTSKTGTYFEAAIDAGFTGAAYSDIQRIERYDRDRNSEAVIYSADFGAGAGLLPGIPITYPSAGVVRCVAGSYFSLSNVTVGDIFVMPHRVYLSDALRVRRCKDVTVTRQKVATTAGIICQFQFCENVRVIDPQRGLVADDPSLIASTADGIRFAHTRGYIDLLGGDVAYCGDDALNAQSYSPLPTSLSTSSFTVPFTDIFEVGDRVYAVLDDGTAVTFDGVVQSLVGSTVTMTAPIPVGLTTDNPVGNYDATPTLCIDGMWFDHFRGNVLVQSRGGSIQNSNVEDLAGGVRIWQNYVYFGEGNPPQDIAINSINIRRACRYADFQPAAMTLDGYALDGSPAAPGALRRISVSNVLFSDCPNGGILAQGVATLSIKDNIFENTARGVGPFANSGSEIYANNCTDADIVGNECMGGYGFIHTYGTLTNARIEYNVGMTALGDLRASISVNNAGETEIGKALRVKGSSAAYSTNLIVEASTDATSERAGMVLGNVLVGQDNQGNGTEDFFVYHNTTGTLLFTISPDGQNITFPNIRTTAGASGTVWVDTGAANVLKRSP